MRVGVRIWLFVVLLSGAAEAQLSSPLDGWIFDIRNMRLGQVRNVGRELPARWIGEPTLASYDFGQVVQLDGATRFVAAEDAKTAALPTTAISAETWVLVYRTQAWGGFVGAIQDNGSFEKGWLLGMRGDRFCFAVSSTGADDGDGKLTYLTAEEPFETGRWYHVVGTYDGQLTRLYVNGKVAAETREQSGPILYPEKLTYEVAAYHDDDELHFLRGKMIEVNVFDAVLEAREVATRFDLRRRFTALDREYEGEPAITVAPYLQHGTQTSMTVLWETNRDCTARVEWGPTFPPKERASVDGRREMHEVRLDGLEPGRKYFYRVVSETEDGVELASEPLTFKTAVEDGSPIGFVVVGDSQSNPDVWKKISELAWGERPDFLVHCGDLVGTGGDKTHWVDEFFAPARALLGRVPFFSVLGNHEQDHVNYYRYTANPEPEWRYTFRYGNAEFFMVDSNRDCRPESEQFAWLDDALGRSEATWKIVVHHHPVYTSDSNDYGDAYKGEAKLGDDRVRPLIPLYEKHGVDIVFHGHIHDYERTWPIRDGRVDRASGVRYVQTGGAGGGLEDYAPTRSWFTAKVRRHHHYCTVAIHGNALEFRAYNLQGRLFDFFDLHKGDVPEGGLRIRTEPAPPK